MVINSDLSWYEPEGIQAQPSSVTEATVGTAEAEPVPATELAQDGPTAWVWSRNFGLFPENI